MATDFDPQVNVTKTDLSVLKHDLKLEIIKQNWNLFFPLAVLIGVEGIVIIALIGLVLSSFPP